MLSKETFCEALRKIQAQKDRDEQFSKALTLMGDGHFVFEGGAPLLAALLDVLKEAVNDQYDYTASCNTTCSSTVRTRISLDLTFGNLTFKVGFLRILWSATAWSNAE